MKYNAVTVTQLNKYIKDRFEEDENLNAILVKGEISNFKNHYTGHLYFTLKDENSLIKCIMFKSYAERLAFKPKDGMKVMVFGAVSVFERDGVYQIYAKSMLEDGMGDLHEKFEQLKAKLEKEGLFDIDKKKPLPQIPFKIGVATSAKGAALHDIISTAQRRFPCAEIVLAPCMVQGAEAEPTIISAIKQLDSIDDIEVIIITRGGGSREDLWVFNSEAIARTAFACKKPTVSAIGHEIDFSILDFVCDVRAATPTQAAEIVLPDIYSLKMQLASIEKSNSRQINRNIDLYKNKLALIEKSDGFSSVKNTVNHNKEFLSRLQDSMKKSVERKIEKLEQQIYSRTQILENQSPLNNLKKGYAMIYKGETAAKEYTFTAGETAKIVTFSQELDCEITKVRKRKI